MLRLARERDELSIVDDQFGAPTSSIELADVTRTIVSGVLESRFGSTENWAGLYHMTCSGSTSWCGFARAIFARADSLLHAKVPAVRPISSSGYITRAKRPLNSVLSNDKLYARFGAQLAPWEAALDVVISRLAGEAPEERQVAEL
jgi:dTDP-4-dehydrorhamnose reductase